MRQKGVFETQCTKKGKCKRHRSWYKRHLLEKLKFKEMFTQIILRINPHTLFFMIGHLDTLKRLNRELTPKNKE